MIKASQFSTAAIAAFLWAGAAAGEEVSYRYDSRGRLVLVERPDNAEALKTSYRLDPADNRVSRWTGTGTPPAPPPPQPQPPVPPALPAPVFSVSDPTALEGDIMIFTISKAGETDQSYTVSYATSDGSASDDWGVWDYQGRSGTATFGPSQTVLQILVPTNEDSANEPSETFFLNLSNPSGGAGIADAQGTGTILNKPPQ